MKRKTRKPTKTKENAGKSKVSSVKVKEVAKRYCRHCGGMLKYDFNGNAVCVMCGRDAGHACEACLYAKEEAAA